MQQRSSTWTHRKRIENCLAGEKPDRTPIALWRHFPVDDQTPEGLAAATINFQEQFDFDLVKVTPASSFCLKDWGVDDEWRGNPEGTRDYTRRVIQSPEDWIHLKPLDPLKGHLGAQLSALHLITSHLGERVPVLQTVFSPLSQAKNLAGGDRLITHLRRFPEAVRSGLQTIAQTTQNFIEAAAETGIQGVFFAVQHAQYGLLSEEEFIEFGKSFDVSVLEPARKFLLNMIHLHGTDVMFDVVTKYPAGCINWHDRDTQPNLTQALDLFPGTLCGGLNRSETMVLGDRDRVQAEVRQAIHATGGKRLIIGTGCVLPTIAPLGNILAARRAVEEKA